MKSEMTTFTARVEKNVWKKFSIIATANDTTPTELIRMWVNDYIRENMDAVKQSLDD